MATKGTKTKKIEQVEVQAALDTAKELNLSKVVGDIGSLQVSIQGTLSNVSAALANKIQQLDQVDAAITAKQNRLSELFGIESEAVSLDSVRAQKQEEEDLWHKEKAERQKLWAEEKAEQEKKWKRERDEHEYAAAVQTKRNAEEFESLVDRNKRLEAIRQEMLNRTWTERENALTSKEQEVADLKAQVNGIDARIKAEASKAEAVVSNVLKKHHEHELQLVRKDSEAEKVLHTSKIAALEGNIKNYQDTVTKLEAQLVAARNDAREVANQALQSASGRQVTEALQRAMENQSVAPTKGK